ncbi:anthrone oxygenase family protein [Nonomuraea sp. CA-141351]|uniref:anthrone oxygenase family protein n=1 Tax=Nonomuraea sp. CA-141351 TaxID=3239996 RepID=UPI003D8C8E07
MIEMLLPVALLTSGLAAGVLLGGELGVIPFFMSLPADRYVHAHSFVVGRYDPFQPICLLTTGVIDALIAVFTPSALAKAVFAAGVVVVLSVVFVSRTHTAPMGRWLKTLDPEALPQDWEAGKFRARWARWNRRRAALAVLALVVNVVGAGVLL